MTQPLRMAVSEKDRPGSAYSSSRMEGDTDKGKNPAQELSCWKSGQKGGIQENYSAFEHE